MWKTFLKIFWYNTTEVSLKMNTHLFIVMLLAFQNCYWQTTVCVGAQTGFYQQPGNSTLQSAQLHQHQTSFSLQGNVFGTHNQSHASAGLQSFGSQFLSSPMQMAAAAALTAQQQYRSPNLPNPNYLKGVGTQHIADQTGRSQQLKSPGANQQDVLASVFNSGIVFILL